MISYKEIDLVRSMLDNDEWESLLIDKRDPVTRRLFIERGGKRYCLHYMRSGKTKPHPHKYNVRVKLLCGRYKHSIYLDDGEKLTKAYDEYLQAGTTYQIDDPDVFHEIEVEPLAYSWSLMINDYNFTIPNDACISTDDNGLGPIPEDEKQELIKEFRKLL
jgi:hypothetical protein